MTEIHPGLAKLREPFAPHQIGRKPKGGVQLEFVGHAALTDRLLEVDPHWTWEPVAFDERGLPALDGNGGLWIRLTVCGVTRLGYGDADGKKGAVAVKEAIGDALRNAGMRFGAALDLWHKGDLHDAAEEQGRNAESAPQVKPAASKPASKPAAATPKPEDAKAQELRRDIIAAAESKGVKPPEVSALVTEFGGKGNFANQKDVEVLKQVLAKLTGQPYEPPF